MKCETSLPAGDRVPSGKFSSEGVSCRGGRGGRDDKEGPPGVREVGRVGDSSGGAAGLVAFMSEKRGSTSS